MRNERAIEADGGSADSKIASSGDRRKIVKSHRYIDRRYFSSNGNVIDL